MRTLVLRAHGYDTTAMEFVSSAHTPKNTLLRAQRLGGVHDRAAAELSELRAALGDVTLELERRMPPPGEPA